MSKAFYLQFTLTLFLAALTGSQGRAGGVDNGQGIAEKNIMFSYLEMGKSLDLCLGSDSCKLSPSEAQLLNKIRFSLISEAHANLKIIFKSGTSEPSFFMIDGFLRIAKTGSSIGDPISVNLDLLYPKDSNGVAIPLSVPGATATLVHELGHHQGEKDHTVLDLLGSKVQMLLMGHLQEVNYGRYQGQISATFLDFYARDTSTQGFVTDGTSLTDLNPIVNEAARCFDGSVPLGIWLWNARWDLYALYQPNAQGEVTLPLRTEMILTCPNATNPFFLEDRHQLIVEVPVKKSVVGRYQFTGSRVQAFPIDCRDGSFVNCL